METPTINDFVKAYNKKGYKVFTKPYSMNLCAVRSIDNKANTFNDFIAMFYYDNKKTLNGVVIPGTVDAGKTYRLAPMNKNGFPIIKHNMQHFGAFEFQEPEINNKKLAKEGKPLEKGHNGKTAFRQIEKIEYWRDNDKNPFVGSEEGNPDFESLPTYIEIANTNGHDMGTLGKEVNNWSAGCWGATENNMDKLYDLARLQIKKGLGKRFTFTLFYEEGF